MHIRVTQDIEEEQSDVTEVMFTGRVRVLQTVADHVVQSCAVSVMLNKAD